MDKVASISTTTTTITKLCIYNEIEPELSMKLLVDSQNKRVLFAEANKECVDFLFYILTLPVSTLIRLLGKQGMVGSLGNLYESLETLNQSYIQPNRTKDSLLKPAVGPDLGYSFPLLSITKAPAALKQFYRCRSCSSDSVSDDPRVVCSNCRDLMNRAVSYVPFNGGDEKKESGGEEGGFVKGVVTYMVMDDLVVKPMSTISSITLLNQFKIKDVLTLEEKVVTFGMNKAVELLKASLETDKVLTNVFLNVKK